MMQDNSGKPALPVDMSTMFFSRHFKCPHCSGNLRDTKNLLIRDNDIRDIRLVNYESEAEEREYPSSRVVKNPVKCSNCRGQLILAKSYQDAAKMFQAAADLCISRASKFND